MGNVASVFCNKCKWSVTFKNYIEKNVGKQKRENLRYKSSLRKSNQASKMEDSVQPLTHSPLQIIIRNPIESYFSGPGGGGQESFQKPQVSLLQVIGAYLRGGRGGMPEAAITCHYVGETKAKS